MMEENMLICEELLGDHFLVHNMRRLTPKNIVVRPPQHPRTLATPLLIQQSDKIFVYSPIQLDPRFTKPVGL